jgi:hypothetical protein
VTPPGLLALLALAAAGPTMTSPVASQSQQEYRLGKAAGTGREARAHYQRGIDSARSVLATTADEPGALLWLAANLAGEALTHGKVFALGVIPEIESTLLRLEQTSPLYDHAAAARGLANLYWKAPALISVGSSRKAAAFFQQALARAPNFPANQAMAAAFFADRGDCAQARALAAAVDGRTDLETFGPDAAEWRQLARSALQDCR